MHKARALDREHVSMDYNVQRAARTGPMHTKVMIRLVFSLCLAAALAMTLLLAGISTLSAQVPAPASEQETATPVAEEGVFTAPVVIDGVTLFQLRGSSVLPAVERAAKVQERIIRAAELSGGGIVKLDIRDHEFGKAISHRGIMLTITTPSDAEFEQMDIDVVAGLQAEAIKNTIRDYRASRSSDARVSSAIEAALWTLAFAAVSFFFFRYRRRVREKIADAAEQNLAGVEKATKDFVRGRAVADLVAYAFNILAVVGYFFVVYYYVSFVLFAFVETRPFADLLISNLTEPIMSVLMGIVGYMPNLVTLAVIAFLTSFAIKGVRLFFKNVEAGTLVLADFEPHWIWPTFNIFRGVLVLIAIVFAFPYIPGSDSAAFQGITILVGVMVSLGSNSVVGNILSGLFVIYRRSTNIGDRIKVGDHVGDVLRIKLMETHIKSVKNELISIPNAQLLNSEVVNYSTKIDGRGLLLHTTVGIGYEEPQEKVEAMLIEAALRTKGLKNSPKPFVLWTSLADYAISYQINAFTTRGSSLPKILSDLHRNIVAVFNENKVQIMTPSYEADPPDPKIPSETWNGRLAESDDKSLPDNEDLHELRPSQTAVSSHAERI
jgi:small-conductance mechanosensitive channel